jgi:hypothetical protein
LDLEVNDLEEERESDDLEDHHLELSVRDRREEDRD